MATIQFKALGKKDPVNLNMRFFHNKINCYAKSNIFVDNKDWSEKTHKIKQTAPDEIKKYVNETIDSLSKFVLNSFKLDFPKGEQIDSNWLFRQIDLFYGKPNDYDDYRYYFVPFMRKYIEESKTRVNPRTNEQISSKTIQNYTTTLTQVEDFEKHINCRFRIKEINLSFHKKFTSYLKVEFDYGGTLIEKYVSQIKGFVKEAKIEGFETSPEIESAKFTYKRDEPIDTYLNETEIDLLFDLDLTDNKAYDNVRDLFIVGVWTGLRISDLKRLNTFRVTDSRIQISATEKNNASVEIPIHSQLKQIILKYNGVFPEISDQKFNLYIKEVCRIAGINEMILGRIKDPEKNRKKLDYYPKYKLISSHTCRRSFVSNHYGKIDDKTIMAITTHKSHSQFMKYVKTTSKEFASRMDDHWKEREELKNREMESQLRIIS
jgi:integrase